MCGLSSLHQGEGYLVRGVGGEEEEREERRIKYNDLIAR